MVPAPRTATLLICLYLDVGPDLGWLEGGTVLLGGILQAPAGDLPERNEAY